MIKWGSFSFIQIGIGCGIDDQISFFSSKDLKIEEGIINGISSFQQFDKLKDEHLKGIYKLRLKKYLKIIENVRDKKEDCGKLN